MKRTKIIGFLLTALVLSGMLFVPESIGLHKTGIRTLGVLTAGHLRSTVWIYQSCTIFHTGIFWHIRGYCHSSFIQQNTGTANQIFRCQKQKPALCRHGMCRRFIIHHVKRGNHSRADNCHFEFSQSV